jgi:hypothetical protein
MAYVFDRQAMAPEDVNMRTGCAIALFLVIAVPVIFVTIAERVRQHAAHTGLVHHQQSTEISQIIFAHYERKNKPPTNLEDLEPYADEFPDAYRALSNGRWTVRWGIPIKKGLRWGGNHDLLIAIEKGGRDRTRVIYGDGSISMQDTAQLSLIMEGSVILHEIAEMYFKYLKERNKSPERPEDLQPYSKTDARGYKAISTGEWIVRWGMQVSDDAMENADTILAYEARILNQHDSHCNIGLVLTTDGIGHIESRGCFPAWLEATPTAHQIARMYLTYHKDHREPPARFEDLQPYAERFPIGYKALADHTWDVRWNISISDIAKENRDRQLAQAKRKYNDQSTDASQHWTVFADNSACVVPNGESDTFWRLYPD